MTDHYPDPETGLAVFTREFHLKKGRCCGNACRHCPFGHIRAKKHRHAHWAGEVPGEVSEEPWVWSGAYPDGGGRVAILPYLRGRYSDVEKITPVLQRLGWYVLLAPILTSQDAAVDAARVTLGFSPIPAF